MFRKVEVRYNDIDITVEGRWIVTLSTPKEKLKPVSERGIELVRIGEMDKNGYFEYFNVLHRGEKIDRLLSEEIKREIYYIAQKAVVEEINLEVEKKGFIEGMVVLNKIYSV